MEPIAYDTLMNANRTGHWPCHGRYAEKRVMLKAAHTNHCELSYEKQKFFQTTQETTRVYVRLVWDAPLLSRCVARDVFVGHTSE